MVATRIWDHLSGSIVPYMGPDLVKALSELVKARMAAEKRSVKAMAKDTGLSTGTIDRIRGGENAISIDKLEGLARGFGLKPWELLRELEGEAPKKPRKEGDLSASDPDTVGSLSAAHKHFLLTVRTILGKVPPDAVKALDRLMWSYVPKLPDEEPELDKIRRSGK